MPAPPLTLLLAAPRGFCAGVDRAIQIVEKALDRYGPPIHVRHEIVHNRHVVEELERKGAVFVRTLDEVPAGSRVIFSAHGVSRAVTQEARRRGLLHLDATCPLVSKVHGEARRYHGAGRHVIMIGHEGHPEVAGTRGQLPAGAMSLVETAADAAGIAPPDSCGLAYVTQTTLSVDDTRTIVAVLKARFPDIIGPRKEDICYATTNRQNAVKAIAAEVDVLLVVGAENSSNSQRLLEVARRAGARRARLVRDAAAMDWDWLGAPRTAGLTAGASAPGVLVRGIVDALGARFALTVHERVHTAESVRFNLPRALTA